MVEIRSPGDESYEKLPFYFEVGCEEVWIIHRDTKVPELFVRGAKGFVPAPQDALGDGAWLVSPATGIALRSAPDAKLALRMVGDAASEAIVPADRRH